MDLPLEKANSEYLNGFQLVVAGTDATGAATFLSTREPVGRTDPGASERVKFWAVPSTAQLPFAIGSMAADTTFPGVNGTTFGVTCYPPHSAGKRRFTTDESTQGGFHREEHPDPTMHRTDTVEYEVILSGKVDLELSSGEKRTLTQGNLVVMGGVGHSWKNVYDEPCVIAVVSVGAQPDARDGRSPRSQL